MSDYIEFNTEQIAQIATATRGHQSDWDAVWEGVRGKLSATVSEALDALTGSSLQDRTNEYHRKTEQYTAQLNSQQVAVGKVGDIATETNRNMSNVIRG